MRVEDYAARAGVSASTVRRWCSRKKIKAEKVPGGVDQDGQPFRSYWEVLESPPRPLLGGDESNNNAGGVESQREQHEVVRFPLESKSERKDDEQCQMETVPPQEKKLDPDGGGTATAILWILAVIAVLIRKK